MTGLQTRGPQAGGPGGPRTRGARGHGPGASSGSSLAKTAIWQITNFQLSHGAI